MVRLRLGRKRRSNWTKIAGLTTPSPGTYTDLTVGADADHNGYPDIIIEAREGGSFNQYNKLKFFKETPPFTALNIFLYIQRIRTNQK
jgi:hypothetical protein